MKICSKIKITGLVLAFLTSLATAGFSETHQVGQISFENPANWEQIPVTSSMRAYQFQIPKVEPDQEDALMAVFFFGTGEGGSVESNIARWEQQFQAANPDLKPEKQTLKVNDLNVTTVFLHGTFMSGMPMGPQTPKSDFALLGAIVEGPQGNIFFKLTGPQNTIEKSKPQFDTLIQSFKKL
jgi:hypothetical protein